MNDKIKDLLTFVIPIPSRSSESQEIQTKWSVKLVSHPMNSGVTTTGDMSVLIAVTKVDKLCQPGIFLRVPTKFGLSLTLGQWLYKFGKYVSKAELL